MLKNLYNIKFLLLIALCIWSSIIIIYNFCPVFINDQIDDEQKAYESVKQSVVANNDTDYIKLKTSNVILLIQKTKKHYLNEWHSKLKHFVMSCFVLFCTIVFLFLDIRDHRTKEHMEKNNRVI